MINKNVCFRVNSWCAKVEVNRVQHTKSFSIATHGFMESYALCVAFVQDVRRTHKKDLTAWGHAVANNNEVIYRTAIGILERCKPTNHHYPSYRARGTRCLLGNTGSDVYWELLKVPGYSKGLTIERIDNKGDYSASNIKWATRWEQQANRSITVQRVGVSYSSTGDCWVSRLQINGRVIQSSFSCKKYGFVAAHSKALAARGAAESLL